MPARHQFLSHLLPASVILTVAIAACAESGLPVAPPDTPTPPLPSATLVAHIDGHDYTATPGTGFASQSVEINKGGIVLRVMVANAAAALDAPLNDTDFELRVMGDPDGAPLAPLVEFTRYDAFSGSLYWVAPGQRLPLYLGLYHKSKGHFDMGPFSITVHRLPHETD